MGDPSGSARVRCGPRSSALAARAVLALSLLVVAIGLPDAGSRLLGTAQAQEADQQGRSQEQASPDKPTGGTELEYSYSRDKTGCDDLTGMCTRDSETQSFSGSAMLQPTSGGFEGEGTGTYHYTRDSTSSPVAACPGGRSSHIAYSGPATLTVHAQCSIDNTITGGPDTSMYDRDTTVVEQLVEGHGLHTEGETQDCDGRRAHWTSEEGSAGFGCFYYNVDFDKGGAYRSLNPSTEDTSGVCSMQIRLPRSPQLRVFGSVQGLIDGKGPVPISNARMVLGNLPEEHLQKLSLARPQFRKATTTSDDRQAKYAFTLPLCGEPPDLFVVSTLWYGGKPEFAITNGPEPQPGQRGIPVYLAACIDDDPQSHCFHWRKAGDDFEAEVNLEYGNDDLLDREDVFMDSEEWTSAGSTTRNRLMADSAYIYYNSHRAMKYFESLALGVPANPVMIQGHYLAEDCAGIPQDAWFRPVSYRFGELGKYLPAVDARGGVFICSAESDAATWEAPVNREWHELGHYLLYEMYAPRKSCATGACKSHRGFKNANSSDSYIEGFAEFTAALISKYYGNAAPSHYPVGDTIYDLELDYKSGGRNDPPGDTAAPDEEFALAGILWDLNDPGKEVALKQKVNGTLRDISAVYPNPVDEVSLDAKRILQIIQKGHPQTAVDLYNAFVGTYVSQRDADMIFLDHGFFADVVERNFIQDSAQEKIPESGNAPDRPRRENVPHSLPGSYIVADADATVEVRIALLQGDGQHDYSYRLDMQQGVPAYFTMPPEYYPSRAVFSSLTDDGSKATVLLEVSSDEYWAYIRSQPEASAVFRHLRPIGRVTPVQSGPAH